MKMLLALLALLSAPWRTATTAYAFESFPEFITMTEADQAAFDEPRLLGAEYQSDVLAFMKPPTWHHEWLSHEIAADLSMGSISAVHFLLDTRLKLRAELKPWLQVRLTYFDEKNHDRQARHLIPELVFKPFSRLGLSVYGEPAYGKRENDVGLGLLFWPARNHEIKLFHTFVDVTRQKRSDRTDTFDEEQLPRATGLVGRLWADETSSAFRKSDFIEYAFRWESPTRWIFKDEQYNYRFWRGVVSAYANKALSDGVTARLRFQLDRKFEARDRTGASSSSAADAWKTERAQVHAQADVNGIGPKGRWTLTPGFQFAHRRWSVPRDTYTTRDLVPHVWLRVPTGGRMDGDSWFFQYDLTLFNRTGGVAIGHPSDKDGAVNQRLNLGYSFVFESRGGPRGELRLMAGVDIDAFATRDTWEAGGAQLRFAL